MTVKDPFVLLPRPLLVNTSLTGRTLPFLRRDKIVVGRSGAEFVVRVHESERTLDTAGAESMRAHITSEPAEADSEADQESASEEEPQLQQKVKKQPQAAKK